jgi:RND family efflux transporter MFP subunit
MTTEIHSAKPVSRAPLRVAAVTLVAIAAVTSLLLGTARKKAEGHEADRRARALELGPVVQSQKVTVAPANRTVTVSGEVRAYRETTLFAKVSGYLKLVRVDKGDRVAENEVLGVIEAPEVEQEIASKRADLSIKKLTDARYKALAQSGVLSQQDTDKAAADVQIATADLARLGALRGYQVIRAPFAGTITARFADPGALLQAATSSQSALPLVRVADLDRVRIALYLSQNEALAVHVGDPVSVLVDGRPAPFEAKISRFERELDPRTRTMLTEVELDNREAQLYPGTFVHVRLAIQEAPALQMPADAVVYQGGKAKAAVVRGGKATFVPIEVTPSDGQSVRVSSGVAEGDRVIRHPSDDVGEGAPVREQAEPTAKR